MRKKLNLQIIQYFRVVIICFFISTTIVVNAAYFSFQPHTIQQPNGEVINCFVSGDEYFNWLHDSEGYTIIQSQDGYFYYGIKSNGQVIPSNFKVNSVNPEQAGLEKWAKISDENYRLRKAARSVPTNKSITGPSVGAMANIVIFIRFSGDTEFPNARTILDNKLNTPNSESLKHYFDETSYGNLDITSHYYPTCALTTNLSYQDSYPRAYYQPYNASTNPTGYQDDNDSRDREHTLLVNAVNFIASQVPTSLNIDIDNDGNVDNVSFMVRGNSGAWADLLWAHRWSLYSQTVNINGKRVWDYTFQPENQTNTNTLCHEMFHVVGSPDLYRYSQDGFNPVGVWDLMASGFVHMGAYMKWKYSDNNWISSIPEITVAGTYTLHPVTSPTNNVYKIASPSNPDEFFILEYRRKTGTYENNLPASGLLIYRINTAAGDGNASGPPDEVYVYRPNGTLTDNGNINNAVFSANSGRTEFNDVTNPPCFLSNNQLAGIEIYDVTTADTTISFTFGIDYKPTASFEAMPPVSCNGDIHFVDLSSKMPTSWLWKFGDGTTSTLQNPTHTYYTNGYKTITLYASNSYGIDSLVRMNYIRIDKPIAPAASNQGNCTPTSFVLNASVNYGGELHWYNQATGGTLLHIGNSFTTPILTQTTTYYVEELIPAQILNVGPATNAIGDGIYFNNTNTHYLIFDCMSATTLKSVLVYAQGDKDRRIVIKDKTDTIIRDTTIYLTTGQHRLELNFDLPADVNYKIECLTPNALLYRNSSGTNFPYQISGVISIHGNSASNLNYYYFFYDWEVLGDECISRRKEVLASILEAKADFTYSMQNLNVNFTNTSLNTNQYVWDFGDGNNATSTNPQNQYTSEGYYDVMLIATGDCGTDTSIQQLAVFYQDINEGTANNLWNIYPNPVDDYLFIECNYDGEFTVEVLNVLGQTKYYKSFSSGSKEIINIPFSNLSQGIYLINITGKNKITYKIIKS
ncbi:MAG: M6 family metalloprotease domain-containing protein [Bacteroidales bacterium]|nr:M6 family metalloprotease domain-containing protein [Bacteroidales bacterium]